MHKQCNKYISNFEIWFLIIYDYYILILFFYNNF